MVRTVGTVGESGHLEPSDHVCWVVDGGTDYDASAAAYVRQGARAGEKVLVFGPEHRLLTGAVAAGAAAVVDPRVAFLRRGRLDTGVMLEVFREQAALARAEGYRGLRVVADMDWIRPAPEQDTFEFELRLDEVVAEIGASAVCAYRSRSFEASELAHVLSVHPAVAAAGHADLGFRLWSCGERLWELSGEVDVDNAGAFETALRAAAGDGALLVLRTEGLTFIDLAGMRAVVRVARAVPGCRIRFEVAASIFGRCWALAGFGALAPSVELVS